MEIGDAGDEIVAAVEFYIRTSDGEVVLGKVTVYARHALDIYLTFADGAVHLVSSDTDAVIIALYLQRTITYEGGLLFEVNAYAVVRGQAIGTQYLYLETIQTIVVPVGGINLVHT